MISLHKFLKWQVFGALGRVCFLLVLFLEGGGGGCGFGFGVWASFLEPEASQA